MKIDLTTASAMELNAAIQRLALTTKKEVKEELTKQMRLLCVDLSLNTRPLEKGKGGKIKGEANVSKKILNIYLPIEAAIGMLDAHKDGYGAAFMRMVKKGDLASAGVFLGKYTRKKFDVGKFDGGALHRQQAFLETRVKHRMIVLDYDQTVKKYITKVQKSVGYAKGGFASAARDLGGTRGIPGYASRHKSPGSGSVTGTGDVLTISIINGVKYIREALKPDKEKQALDFRKRQIEAVMDRITKRRGSVHKK